MTDVVIVSGDNAHLVDALSAGPLATLRGAPVLLTQERVFPAATAAEVKRLGATRAYIIGTVDVIGTAVETALRAAGVTTIVRLGGADRYATAVAVSQEISPPGRALAMLVEEAGMVRDIQINVGKGRKKNAQVTDVVLPATTDVPTPTLTLGGGTIPDLAHGQDVLLSGANTGRVGAAAAGESTYSATTNTVTGSQTYSTNHTFNNTIFTGAITITGGTQIFNCCSFTFAPTAQGYPQVWVQGGNVTFNWCTFDSGQRGTQGYFETRSLYLGDQSASPMSFASTVVTAYRCRFSSCGNGVSMWNYAPTTTALFKECLVNYLTQGGGTDPSHGDAFEIYTTSNVTLQRCRMFVESAIDGSQSCVNITTDGGNDTTRRPITVDSCYVNGGIAPILTRWWQQGPSTGPIYNVRFINNRFGDYFVYSSLCDFNRMNVTADAAYQATTDPTCIYWADSNVWDPTGADLGHTTGTSGDAILGLPHTAGATVTSANFTQNYPNVPEPWIWDDSTNYGWVGGSGGATAPAAPTIGTAVAGNANATVAWTDGSDGGSAITGYTVTPYISGVAQTASTYTVAQTTLNGSVRSVVKSGLTNGTAYTFRVAATNAISTGPQSGPSNSVTPTGTVVVPGIPTIGTATAGNASASITFTPGSNGGDPNVTYQALSNPGSLTGTSTSSPVTVTGLTNGTAYTFTVRATNSAGSSNYSQPSNSVTPTASTMPGGNVTHGDQLTINHVGPWTLQGVAKGQQVYWATPIPPPSPGWWNIDGTRPSYVPNQAYTAASVTDMTNTGGVVGAGGLTVDGIFLPAGTFVAQNQNFQDYGWGCYSSGGATHFFRGCNFDCVWSEFSHFNNQMGGTNFAGSLYFSYCVMAGNSSASGDTAGVFIQAHQLVKAVVKRCYSRYFGSQFLGYGGDFELIENISHDLMVAHTGNPGAETHCEWENFCEGTRACLVLRNKVLIPSPDPRGESCNQTQVAGMQQDSSGGLPGDHTNSDGSTGYVWRDNYFGGGGAIWYGGEPADNANVNNLQFYGNKVTTRYWPDGGGQGGIMNNACVFGTRGNVWSNNTWADDYGSGEGPYEDGITTLLPVKSGRQYPNGNGPRAGTAIGTP